MLKHILIISPYFPPSNAADMQRIRMSLPYFKELGWEAEVICVKPVHSEMVKDILLNESIPGNIKIHEVNAFSKKWTSKIGLGSLALRSLLHYRNKVNQLLKAKRYDLIYFSTTQFPVCILGAYWKKKFNIPYVIDMQDPWHSDYYQDKPKNERPPKYWFSYRLNKWLEPAAMKEVSGLISVSDAYIQTLRERYSHIQNIPAATITFGAFFKDMEIVEQYKDQLKPAFDKEEGLLNLVYTGRGGHDMQKALKILFHAFKKGLDEEYKLFSRFRMHFIGTSYAPKGQGKQTIAPLAKEYGLENYVSEQTNRIPFYGGLATLNAADGLIVPGSDDPAYTASKLYPYILAQKSLLGIFHPCSSAVNIIRTCKAGEMITLKDAPDLVYITVKRFLEDALSGNKPETDWEAFEPYTSKEMTRKQCELFEKVILKAPHP